MLFDEMGQIIHEYLAKPCQQLLLGGAAELSEVLVRPEHRLLHHIGGADPWLQPFVDLRGR